MNSNHISYPLLALVDRGKLKAGSSSFGTKTLEKEFGWGNIEIRISKLWLANPLGKTIVRRTPPMTKSIQI